MRDAAEDELKSQICLVPLTQEKITSSLERIKKVITLYMPEIQSFYIADYSVDRSEALEYLSKHAGYHYRKNFCLKADPDKIYKKSPLKI